MNYQEYWSVIKEKICGKCIDGDGSGNCRLDPSIDCALQQHLPFIVNVVNHIKSDKIDDYIRELRLVVCERCKYQTVNGYCALRTEVDCALDRYFPLVIEAIEDLQKNPLPS
jgi:hypothetical protein